MKTPTQHFKKAFMWYKVNELHSKGLNKSQISVELGMDRATVRKYLSMDESSFLAWISVAQHRPKKLKEYAHFVKTALEAHSYLSASQVEDWLKEHYPDLPYVHSKTVYNFVEQIRKEFDIPKTHPKSVRQYEKLPQTAYGDQAQADFGSFHMPTKEGGVRKVYFFVMILSRSRYKFVLFQDKPFTSKTTIEAHNQAFEYFQGQPDKILYDQDRVLMVDENLGDLILTREFQLYSSAMTFTPVFCRKADPESKGKVENVVGYVKKNFLPGRTYINEKGLNESVRDWLTRTGNGKKHAGTQKIPSQEWLIERDYLHPYYQQIKALESLLPYKVRKDNTISYKGNFYTLPLNTYQGVDTTVLLKIEDDMLSLYASDKTLLTTHKVCNERGQIIRNTDHRRDKSQSLEVLKAEVTVLMENVPSYRSFIEQLTVEKQRYLRDNLQLLKTKTVGIEPSFLEQAVHFCMENAVFNANTLIQTALHYQKESQAMSRSVMPQVEIKSPLSIACDYEPQTSKINTYQKLMQ
jgi:5'(3')-deoxyribonucleotidase/transposase